MPYNVYAPNFALLASFDARPWSGVDVISYASQTVTLPEYGLGEGVYEDALHFLNGRGVGAVGSISGAIGTFEEALNSASTFGTTWSVELTEDDRIKIICDVDFLVSPISSDPLGLGSQNATYDVTEAHYYVIGELDWVRGVYRGERYLFSDGGTPPTLFTAFSSSDQPWAVQDVVCGLRQRGLADADDLHATDCLEALVRTDTGTEARFILNDDGHVEVWHLDSSSFSWLSSSFRDRLGFTGDEVGVVNGSGATNTVTLTATHPMPGALFPSRPFQDHHLSAETISQSRRLIGGGYTSNFVGRYITSALSFDLDALLDQRDLYRHFTDRFMQYAPQGERVNFYQGWGDSRRALTSAEVTADQPAYDLVFTSEDNGDQGRIRASMITSSHDLSFGDLKRRVPVQMRLEHL